MSELSFTETGYPLQVEATWDAGVDPLARACLSTLRCCLHETYMDCPHHEQMQYAGDTRIQALLTLATTRDDRPVRSALRHFASSRCNASGLTTSAHPGQGGQLIPPFSLAWIGMLHDLARWRPADDEIRSLMPDVRAVLDVFLRGRTPEDLVRAPYGWNFVDWRPGFAFGVPPGCEPGEIGAALQWQLVGALAQAADLEQAIGEPEMVARWRAAARRLAQAAHRSFWVPAEQRYADRADHPGRSQHTQILALLSGHLPDGITTPVLAHLLADRDTVDCGIMFSHYLFQVAAEHGSIPYVRSAWSNWRSCLDQGFTTLPESWGTTRSDCHAWSAHPLFHYLTGVAGIRPAAMGFAEVLIAPQPDDTERVGASIPHPSGGSITVDLRRSGGGLRGTIVLPKHVPGTLLWAGASRRLPSGGGAIDIAS
jgi:hypothetical protein